MKKLDLDELRDKNTIINEYDKVELLVEDEKYSKYGVHKGDTGCVMEIWGRDDVEVDFSGIDEKGNFMGLALL